jgi:hypothetical protein
VRKNVPRRSGSEQLQTYEQLLTPERDRSGYRRLITGGALGLAVLGATRLAWRFGKALKDEKRTPAHPSDKGMAE